MHTRFNYYNGDYEMVKVNNLTLGLHTTPCVLDYPPTQIESIDLSHTVHSCWIQSTLNIKSITVTRCLTHIICPKETIINGDFNPKLNIQLY